MSIKNIYKQLREEVIFYLESVKILEISDSEESIDALSNLITGKLFTLDFNQIMYGLLLNSDGSIRGLIQIMMFEDKFWLIVAEEDNKTYQYLMENLSQYAITDVTKEWNILSLEGPKSWGILKEVIGYDILGLQFMNFMDFEINDREVFVSRVGLGGEYGYKIFVPKDDIDNIQAEIPLTLQQIPSKLFDITSSETRLPKIGTYLKKGDCPIESELRWMIDFRKDDFIGRDSVIEKLENYQYRLIAFIVESKLDTEILDEDRVYLDNESIGSIKYLTYSPHLDRYIGYALLKKEWAYSGIREYQIKNSGLSFDIETISTPFFLTKSFFIEMD
jgi:glycine cleavage system aminomethyltransferase T